MPILCDLLLLEALPKATEAALKKHFTLHYFTTYEALLPIAHSIKAVATGGSYGIANNIMSVLPALEIIAVNGVGLDRIDLNEARRRSISVTVTTNISTGDVADSAMMLLLTLKRQFIQNEDFLRSGQWRDGSLPPLAHSLTGLKVGIAGFGRIGKAISRRALASDMTVAYFSSHQHQDSSLEFFDSLNELASWCDVLILSLSAGPRSYHLVDSNTLKSLGSMGVLINIARGSIVDEIALLEALKNNIIAGAGLDVFQNEPNINSEFLTLNNTVLQPHQGSATLETRLKMGQNIIDNLLAHFNGHPLLTPAI